jgi:hypothetical protein
MTMMTKDELLKYLKGAKVGDTLSVTGKEMSAIFGVDLNCSAVKAWLNDVGLSGFKIKDDGRGTISAWVFERRS